MITLFYRMNTDAVSEYFPSPVVFKGLFNLCSKLFGIKFQVSVRKIDFF